MLTHHQWRLVAFNRGIFYRNCLKYISWICVWTITSWILQSAIVWAKEFSNGLWGHQLYTLRWRHNESDGVSNHQRLDCLLIRLFRRRSKKASKLRVTGLCEENSPVTGVFPAQRASNAENVSIWWRHHDLILSNGTHVIPLTVFNLFEFHATLCVMLRNVAKINYVIESRMVS